MQALEDYKTNVQKYGPVGSASFSFDEAFNVAARAGLQLHHLQHVPCLL